MSQLDKISKHELHVVNPALPLSHPHCLSNAGTFRNKSLNNNKPTNICQVLLGIGD